MGLYFESPWLVPCLCLMIIQTISAQCGSRTERTMVTKAVANLYDWGAGGNVKGTVIFCQSYIGGPTSIQANITGLKPGKHGFHIHQLGNFTGGCTASAGHYNPTHMVHSSPNSLIRHNGDLGNIVADSSGKATLNINDRRVQLNGMTSVIGRSIVIHSGEDDLGKGNNPGSLKTGNAGSRVACGGIGIAEERRLCNGR